MSKDRPGVEQHIKSQFRKNAVIPKTDVLHIEQILRRSQRQLDQLKKPSVRGIGSFQNNDGV